MKKLGNWYVPDSDGDHKLKMVIDDKFQCSDALATAFQYVKRFENAIDVGTWIGDSTVIMSNRFKHIIGFEPSAEVYNCCIENLKARNIDNCKIQQIGLSNKSGPQLLLNKAKTFSGWISTLELTDKEKTRAITVDTCRLDDLKLTDIDFIKIDVDSHEGFLIDGAREFFKNNAPVIMMENKVRDQQKYQNESMPNPITILASLNYKLVKIAGKADCIFVKQHKVII